MIRAWPDVMVWHVNGAHGAFEVLANVTADELEIRPRNGVLNGSAEIEQLVDAVIDARRYLTEINGEGSRPAFQRPSSAPTPDGACADCGHAVGRHDETGCNVTGDRGLVRVCGCKLTRADLTPSAPAPF